MDNFLWKPSAERVNASELNRFQSHLKKHRQLEFNSYSELHNWSVKFPKEFWSALIDFYGVVFEGNLDFDVKDLSFNNHAWFSNMRMNFAENLLRTRNEKTGLNFLHESGKAEAWSYGQIYDQVASLAGYLKDAIDSGDVVAAYMPNIPHTAISMLACTSLGGVFTSTSCDFGVEGVVDRFGQSKPKVLISACGYEYNGKYIDLVERIGEIKQAVPSIEKVILVDFLGRDVSHEYISWESATENSSELTFKRLPFSHPLYIMYSSGTTGKPKCIVHSAGGVLLQHLKELGLHCDLTSEKNIFYFTTCGWMMWNWLISSLAFGSTVTLYEGSPGYPNLEGFLEKIKTSQVNIFGTSPKFLKALQDSGKKYSSYFESVDTILSTGAPLLPEQFDYIYQQLKADICVSSICGGTDIIGCFMLGNPTLPVYRGEIQCLGLGMDVDCFSSAGESLRGEEGELVCKTPFPSQPVYFLDDEDRKKINKAYFDQFSEVWHHGDFIQLTDRNTVQVFGRSDATLNPGGVRIGTSEIYRQTELIPYIEDSLCVGKNVDGDVEVVLFVKFKMGEELSKERVKEIQLAIKEGTTPRHVPRSVYQVTDIPYTRSGKKMELAITRLLQGKEIPGKEAMANPDCLEDFTRLM